MKKIIFGLIGLTAGISAASAQGTYYNYGNYAASQSSGNQARAGQQQRMAQQFGSSSSYSPQGGRPQQYLPGQQQQMNRGAPQSKTTGSGISLNAYAGYENADFGFHMQEAGSEINFNNITWMKFGADGSYMIDAGSMKIELKAGFEYGIQGASGSVTDDDLSHTAGIFVGWAEIVPGADAWDIPFGNALSNVTTDLVQLNYLVYGVGEQGSGSSLGAFASIGLGSGFKIGDSVTIKPSVGYRYESYHLIGQNTLSMATATLILDDMQYGELLSGCSTGGCSILHILNAEEDFIVNDAGDYIWVGAILGAVDGDLVSAAISEAHHLDGVTHDYKVAWHGPFIAADVEIKTAQNSGFNLRAELGFPGYSSEGDQPLRGDLAHPLSFYDSAPLFSAMHYGLSATYSAGITDNMAVNIGWRWDYYKVNGADAETFFAPGTDAYYEFGKSHVLTNEITARYRTSGVRAGINAKF